MAQLKTGTTIGGRNIVQELDSHKNDYVSQMAYAVASGTNSYTVSIPGITALVEGLSVKIKFTNANTGASTLNINGLGAKEIRKSNGNALSAGNIKAGQICHLVYTGSNFQCLGEGGEYGTAQAGDVLSGKTIGTESGIITGIMPNNGAINNIITTQNGQIAIPQGYHNGSGIVKAQFANLVAENVKKNINIGGVVGSYTPDYYVFSSLRPLTGGQYRIDGLYFNPRQLIIRTSITFSHGSRDIDADVALMAGSYTNDLDVYVTSRVDSSDRLRYTLSLNNVSFGSNYVTFYLGWDTYLLGSRPVDSGQYTSDVSGAVIE